MIIDCVTVSCRIFALKSVSLNSHARFLHNLISINLGWKMKIFQSENNILE